MTNPKAKLKCVKCGYEPNIISDVCIKCGGEVVKICGACGFENKVEKNYCDNCGTLLSLTPEKQIAIEESDRKPPEDKKELDEKSNKKIELEFEPIHETINQKAESYRKKLESGFEYEKSKEELKKIEEEKKKLESYREKKEIEEKQQKEFEDNKNNGKKNFLYKHKLFLIILSSFIISVFVSYFLFIKDSMDKYKLLFVAKNYLSALSSKDYKKAYSFLSENSKKSISFLDFVKTSERYDSEVGGWSFKDVKIYYYSNNQSIITYKIREGSSSWRNDYIDFVKEHDRWVRPYIWNILEKIDEVLSKNDLTTALFLSQKLYLIDPLDPRSSGNLCWSEYYMRLFDKSVESCKRVLDLVEFYPIKYYPDEELFWFKFAYADSLRFTDKYDDALRLYDILISNDKISPKDKCPIYLARSDIYVIKKMYEKAKEDLISARNFCQTEFNIKESIKRFNILEGKSCQDAVDFAKVYKYSGQRISELVNKSILGIKDRQFRIIDRWECKYADGPVYEINVFGDFFSVKGKFMKKIKTQILYKLKVDLWNKNVYIEEVK